jgi:membrane protein YqaA with SNARE-associated domain
MRKKPYLDFENQGKIELPSSRKRVYRRKKQIFTNEQNYYFFLKWWIIIFLILIIYIFYNQIIFYFLSILKSNPTLYSNYLYIENHIKNSTFLGLFIVSILGSLFFLTLPSEALLIYYLSTTNHFFIYIITILIFGNLIGLILNYFFGLILGRGLTSLLFKNKFLDYQRKIHRYGGVILFIGNILPGPIEFLAVFYGTFRFPFLRYVYLCFMGRLFKYIIIFLLYIFFWDQIINLYSIIIENFLILKDLYSL